MWQGCLSVFLWKGPSSILFRAAVHFPFQSTGAEWDRRQLRRRYDARKPVSLWVCKMKDSDQTAGVFKKISGDNSKLLCTSSVQLQWMPEGRSDPSVHVSMSRLTAPHRGDTEVKHTVSNQTHFCVSHTCDSIQSDCWDSSFSEGALMFKRLQEVGFIRCCLVRRIFAERCAEAKIALEQN